MKAFQHIAVFVAASLAVASAHGQKAAQVFSRGEVQQQIEKLMPASSQKGSSGSTLADFGTHALKLSLRSKSGGAEMHAHFDDVMVVLGGSATLVTGGTIADAKTDANGETKGKDIVGGEKHAVAKGDIIHVPAGTPHQLLLTPDAQFTAFVVKIRER